MLTVESLHKSYQVGQTTYEVLKGISLEVEKGEFVAVMGPSGSGKTTLLNCISCYIPADCGEIILGDRPLAALDETALAAVRNKQLGFVFQDFLLLDGLTVRQNILLPAIIGGSAGPAAETRADRLCQVFGITPIQEKYPAEISGGEKQRTAVARALIKRHHLHGEARMAESESEAVVPLNGKSLLSSVCLIIVSAGLGSYIAILAGRIPYIEFPYFIGCMIGGVIVRNILDAIHVKVRAEELDAFGDLCLEIFLGMTMMTIDVTKLAGAFGPFVIIFAAQVIFTCLWAYFVTFRTCGRNYDAAVIAAGHIGMGLGNGPNTMANEKAVMAEHGFSNVGWVVYPPFGLLVLDIFNPIFCSVIAVPLCRLFGIA